MKTITAIAAAVLITSLSGCASLSENECRTADWESIGYRDGSRGYDGGRIANHIDACSEYAVSPDRPLYEEGRQRGLGLFCTSDNGMRIGRLGGQYSGVCPEELESLFLQGYDHGRQLYDMEQRMARVREQIDEVQRQLRREEPPLSDSERDDLLYRLRSLEREYGRMEIEYERMGG